MATNKKSGAKTKQAEQVAPPSNDKFPELQLAVISDRVLREMDSGTVSLIRLVDQLSIPDVVDIPEGEEFPLPVSLGVSFIANEAVGDGELVIDLTAPTGKTYKLRRSPIVFVGGEQATFIHMKSLVLLFRGPGLYWYTISVVRGGKKKRYTRIPLALTLVPSAPG